MNSLRSNSISFLRNFEKQEPACAIKARPHEENFVVIEQIHFAWGVNVINKEERSLEDFWRFADSSPKGELYEVKAKNKIGTSLSEAKASNNKRKKQRRFEWQRTWS